MLQQRTKHVLSLGLGLLILSDTASADTVLSRPVDYVWVALCAALVFTMQAGFALLEGGSARAKNTINVIMKNYVDFCVGVLAFWAVGFGLMFGSNYTGWLGLDHFVPELSNTRNAVFFLFQSMFAATAATIVSGAVAERMRFTPYVIGTVIITSLIYPVYGSWVWGSFYTGSGWLQTLGFIDFAGSTVVHAIGGWCALAAIIVLGPRLGRFGRDGSVRPIAGHNLTLVGLGVFLLWFGWFGFNSGSALGANEDAVIAFANTNLASASAMITWIFLERFHNRKMSALGACVGAIVGLVAITPAAGFVTLGQSIFIGFVAAITSNYAIRLKNKSDLDDTLDVFPSHGVGGMVGMILTAVFAKEVGLIYGHTSTFFYHIIALVIVAVFTFGGSWLLYYIVDILLPMRVTESQEERGLDASQHGETFV